jgi:OmpR family response regulator RpaB
MLQIGDLKLNTTEKYVLKGSRLIHLTLIEFNLLTLLMNKAGESLTRIAILDYIWGCTSYRYVDTRVVDVYISRLRAKLENNVRKPYFILTTRGTGYMFRTVKS